MDASDAGADIDAQPFRFCIGAALVHGLLGCCHGVQGKEVGFAGSGGIYFVGQGVKILDFRSYFYAQIVCVECADKIDSTGARLQAFPKGLDAISYRGNDAHTGNDYSLHKVVFIVLTRQRLG